MDWKKILSIWAIVLSAISIILTLALFIRFELWDLTQDTQVFSSIAISIGFLIISISSFIAFPKISKIKNSVLQTILVGAFVGMFISLVYHTFVMILAVFLTGMLILLFAMFANTYIYGLVYIIFLGALIGFIVGVIKSKSKNKK